MKKPNWGDNLDVRFYLSEELKKIRNKKILDVGCGNGYLARCIDDSNNYIGIDTDADSISKAVAANTNKTFKLCELQDVEDKFDIIILANIIELIEDKEEFLMMAYTRLEERGRILLTTPNGDNIYYKKRGKISSEAMKHLLEPYPHNIYYWNPLPIQTHHLLKYIKPTIINVYTYLMDKIDYSVSFFVEIKK